MYDQCDHDVNDIDDDCTYDERSPDFADAKPQVLAQMVVKRRRYAFKDDDLPFCESPYRDLKDRQAAVYQERKTDDKERKRDLKIHKVESDEESDRARSGISHKDLARIEVEDQICKQYGYHDETCNKTVLAAIGK